MKFEMTKCYQCGGEMLMGATLSKLWPDANRLR